MCLVQGDVFIEHMLSFMHLFCKGCWSIPSPSLPCPKAARPPIPLPVRHSSRALCCFGLSAALLALGPRR